MRNLFGKPRAIFGISFAIGAGVVLLSGLFTGFHAAGNDFWSVLYYGRHITWAQRESLYNGFFPVGYAFLIGQFPYAYAVQLAYVTNALLAGLLTASISSTVAAVRFVPATLFAIAASVTIPILFQYGNTVGPDIGTAAFFAFAMYLLWRDALGERAESASPLRSILIGGSLGLAVLWRSHAVVLALSALFSAVLILGFRARRVGMPIVFSFLAIASIQILVNVISGHGALETAQNFNIYKFLYGIDWTYPPSPEKVAAFSLWEAFRENPRQVLNAYVAPFRYLVTFAWPGAVCFLISIHRGVKKYALFSALVIVLYAVPLAVGDSPRAPLTIMSLFISSIAFILTALNERTHSLFPFAKWVPAVVTIGFLFASVSLFHEWIQQDLTFLRDNRAQHRMFAGLEQFMLSRGMTSPTQVYADKYALYFPHTLPYRTRQIGGWDMDWLWGYREEYPEIPNDSWESFARACREQGIKFIVLSPNAHRQGEFFASIYNGEFEEDKLGLVFVREWGNMKIYRLK